jgi:hippurate hydrolase
LEPVIAAVEKEVDRILSHVRSVRRHLHANPELALCEFNTARFIRSQLASPEITLLPPFLDTDVVALIHGAQPGKNVALRADIDALPMQEMSHNAHRSLHENIMHACGHDGHAAMLIGAALVLERLKNSFCGSVRCVFQPGEEIVAAGKNLVEAGVLDDPRPDAVLALHAWAGHPVGAIGSKPGVMMAAADIFSITIKGRGGHGSRPERTVDPILTATRIINSLYAIPSRQMGALNPVVISVCSIHGGSNANIIPDEVVLEGSVRYLSTECGERLPGLFEHAIRAECDYAGASYHLEYKRPYIPTKNVPHIVDACREVAQSCLGMSSWVDIADASMGAEDFSFYLDRYPGAMFFIGMGEGSPQLHSNCFDFNDEALRNGILFLVLSTLKLLRR